MQSVGQQLGIGNIEVFRSHPSLVCSDAIGVELELEGFTPSAVTQAASHLSPLWTVTHDGSLRNGGVEFITTGGLGGERLHAAFERMVALLDRVNYDASWRCSTHMHINMLDMTLNQVARFMLVYAACEPVLFAHCGQFRRSSNFCTPVGDSIPFHKALISRLYDDACVHRGAHSSCNKYTAMNFMPLFGDGRTRALGTVEFRGGRPMTNMEDFLLQANLLLSIKDFVRTFEGNEEAMLTRLHDGVLNTVYASGCAASLVVSAEELENSMIHSWLLLKAYQQAMATPRRTPAAPNMDELLARPTAARRPAGFTGNPFGNMAAAEPAAGNDQGRQEMVDQIRRLGWYTSGSVRPSEQEDYLEFGIEPQQVCNWARTEWPRFYDYWDHMRSMRNSVTTLAEYAYCVMTDTGFRWRITQEEAAKAILNWKMSRNGEAGEQSPIGMILRAANRRRTTGPYDIPTEGLITNLPMNQQPRVIGNALNAQVDYKSVLTDAEWEEIAGLIGVSVRNLTNFRLFNMLVTALVPGKSPLTLSNNLVEWARIHGAVQGSTYNVVWLYTMLKFARRTSAQHVMRDYLPTYDKYSRVLDLLFANGCTVPFMKTTGAGRTEVVLQRPNGGAGYDITRSCRETRYTEPRTSATTGFPVY